MAVFTVQIEKFRFQIRPLAASQMKSIATDLSQSISTRIRRGETIQGNQAASLTLAYLKRKQQRGLADIRDWFWTGKLLKSLQVLRASENRAVIGFANQLANVIAGAQNKREKMFGVSRSDRAAMYRAVERELKRTDIVQFKKL